ncbi:phage repressor protein CI [Enterobacter cancerogenus]|uniref:phage repressor protein CI n=1 Tax=Enterobacter cancerogenus TaxID=69218 RepID=UPI000734883E|nr:phage repressor protein CI [Enterobacter cancerogenus]KTQ45302.1 repressor [Enterobacter cancerogenus]KTQ52543.1 repressor [Enterobacter cancerogenus]KTQ73769.1 repressor [Enterobacter cancerogenus]KTQ82916.1 repressor [Enterobacter cancerogenus]MDT7009560.1 phage repressor protein CI [Enterobacter cancerogenus]
MILDSQVNNEELLDRICQVYGFTQKIQLARHFNIAASSLQNRYARGTVSYDFAVQCALDTGASLRWLMTGQGAQFEGQPTQGDPLSVASFTLSDGKLEENAILSIDTHFFNKPLTRGIAVRAEGKLHFVEKDASLTDGLWLVEIEGTTSIRDLTLLPGKKLHVAGGKIPFECVIGEIKTVGRVVGIYSEVS